jgi:hypothetical protein
MVNVVMNEAPLPLFSILRTSCRPIRKVCVSRASSRDFPYFRKIRLIQSQLNRVPIEEKNGLWKKRSRNCEPNGLHGVPIGQVPKSPQSGCSGGSSSSPKQSLILRIIDRTSRAYRFPPGRSTKRPTRERLTTMKFGSSV